MEYKILLNGKMFFGENNLKINSPINGELIGSVPACQKKDIDYAFETSRKAFGKWSTTEYSKRIQYILNFKNILLENKEYLANQMVLEIAKNYNDCILEIERTAIYIQKTLDCYLKDFVPFKIIDDKETKIKGKKGYFKKVPVGVVLAISPFNYPVNLSISKIIPALISGNTVVFKPATQGSITATILSKFFHKAKFPPGTINVVTGRGVEIGDYLLKNKEVNVITFTGGPEIGNKIRQLRGDANLILELGGKDPAIIDSDCDLDLVTKEVIHGALDYSGQRCTAIKVVYANKLIEKKLMEKLKNRFLELKIGSPYDNVDIIPLINKNSLEFALNLIKDAKSKKEKIILGGQHDGNFLFPTLIKCTSLNSLIMKEEQFAPIIPIYFYKKESFKKIIDAINKSKYGLQASIFSKNKNFFWNTASQLDVGTVNWNKASSRGPDIFPFIGLRDSGQGVQGIYFALDSMTRIKGFIENE